MAQKPNPNQQRKIAEQQHIDDCMQTRKSAGAIYIYQIEADNLKTAIKGLTEHIHKAKTAFLTINPHKCASGCPDVYMDGAFDSVYRILNQQLKACEGRIESLTAGIAAVMNEDA